jgi:hypothetical protein
MLKAIGKGKRGEVCTVQITSCTSGWGLIKRVRIPGEDRRSGISAVSSPRISSCSCDGV